jgi:hypothetical protein
MNHVEQAVAAIRKSPSFFLMADDEPVTVEALQSDIDALDEAWDVLDDELAFAIAAGDTDEAANIKEDISDMELTYIEACNQLDMLQAAIAADHGSIQ